MTIILCDTLKEDSSNHLAILRCFEVVPSLKIKPQEDNNSESMGQRKYHIFTFKYHNLLSTKKKEKEEFHDSQFWLPYQLSILVFFFFFLFFINTQVISFQTCDKSKSSYFFFLSFVFLSATWIESTFPGTTSTSNNMLLRSPTLSTTTLPPKASKLFFYITKGKPIFQLLRKSFK